MNTDISTYGTVEWVIVATVILATAFLGYQIHWYMNYKWEYSQTKEDKGVITDMRYTPSRTTTSYNGKSTSTTYHAEKNVVYIKTEKLGEFSRNSSRLYQRVRIDDEVIIKYQKRFRVRKDNPRDRQFDSNILKELINPKGRVIKL